MLNTIQNISYNLNTYQIPFVKKTSDFFSTVGSYFFTNTSENAHKTRQIKNLSVEGSIQEQINAIRSETVYLKNIHRQESSCRLSIRKAYLLLLLLLSNSHSANAQQQTSLNIATITDFYKLDLAPELQSLLEQNKKLSTHFLSFGTGDFLSPSPLSSKDEGAHRIDILNKFRINAMVPGNHDFQFCPKALLKRIKESNFSWLAANAVYPNGKPLTGEKQALVIEVDGIKIGVFGLITTRTPNLACIDDIQFLPQVDTARSVVANLKKQGVQVFIALTHLDEVEDEDLAESVPDLNLILGGHDHEPMSLRKGKTLILKSGKDLEYLGLVNMTLQKQSSGKVQVLQSWHLLSSRGQPKDLSMEKLVKEVKVKEQILLAEPIGPSPIAFENSEALVRSEESKFGGLVADAIREYCSSDLAIMPGGTFRGEASFREGDTLTLYDLKKELPFDDLLVKFKTTGKVIKEALENSVSQAPKLAGRFLQISGLQFTYNISHPSNSRVTQILIQGKELDPDRSYEIGTVAFILEGKDNYLMFKNSEVLISPEARIDLSVVIANYIQKSSPQLLKENLLAKRIYRTGSATRALSQKANDTQGLPYELQTININLSEPLKTPSSKKNETLSSDFSHLAGLYLFNSHIPCERSYQYALKNIQIALDINFINNIADQKTITIINKIKESVKFNLLNGSYKSPDHTLISLLTSLRKELSTNQNYMHTSIERTINDYSLITTGTASASTNFEFSNLARRTSILSSTARSILSDPTPSPSIEDLIISLNDDIRMTLQNSPEAFKSPTTALAAALASLSTKSIPFIDSSYLKPLSAYFENSNGGTPAMLATAALSPTIGSVSLSDIPPYTSDLDIDIAREALQNNERTRKVQTIAEALAPPPIGSTSSSIGIRAPLLKITAEMLLNKPITAPNRYTRM